MIFLKVPRFSLTMLKKFRIQKKENKFCSLLELQMKIYQIQIRIKKEKERWRYWTFTCKRILSLNKQRRRKKLKWLKLRKWQKIGPWVSKRNNGSNYLKLCQTWFNSIRTIVILSKNLKRSKNKQIWPNFNCRFT